MAREIAPRGFEPGVFTGAKAHASVLTPESYCFILDLDNQETLSFQLMPEVVSESKSAQYNEIPIIGRSLPHLGYSSSSSRVMGLSLNFVATHGEGKYSPKWVKEQVRWLEAKVYPDYEDGFSYPPHRLLVVVGEAIGLQCVMTSCSTTWMGPWAFDDTTAKPFRAQMDCQFQEFGMNDGESQHPHDHDEAQAGTNQMTYRAEGQQYVDIPLTTTDTAIRQL
ncbi:MAG: hypothetical protein DRH97_05310 [Chloroflexi bacterium]|nr:MAG: hypothetical protein DRH97_05310 [Chloroflexota bacterium]